jgi:hypothetical protein
LISIDVGKDQTTSNDAITFSSLLVVPVQDEKFEKTLIDVNVSQQLCKKIRSKKWCALKWLN